jgi:hypothetical protein
VIFDVTYVGQYIWGFGWEMKTGYGRASIYLNNVACVDYSSKFTDSLFVEGTIIPQ